MQNTEQLVILAKRHYTSKMPTFRITKETSRQELEEHASSIADEITKRLFRTGLKSLITCEWLAIVNETLIMCERGNTYEVTSFPARGTLLGRKRFLIISMIFWSFGRARTSAVEMSLNEKPGTAYRPVAPRSLWSAPSDNLNNLWEQELHDVMYCYDRTGIVKWLNTWWSASE